MSLSLTYAANLTAVETLEGNTDGIAASSRRVTWSAFDNAGTYTGTTVPPVTKIGAKTAALVAGALTIDLTALTGWGANGANVDGTGLKLQFFRVRNLGAADMTFATGGTSGYNFGGPFTVKAGCEVLFKFNDNLPDVAAGVKNIGVTGTGTDTAEVTLVLG